jgi:hypothetical protein
MRLAVVSFVFLLACSKEDEPVTAPLAGNPEITVTTLLSNQGIIWGFDVLPNGNLLFTQKAGTMRFYDIFERMPKKFFYILSFKQ